MRVTLPLPGANFFYSLAKDAWGWGSSRWRGRHLLRPEVFRRWTVDQWYRPDEAIREFEDQDLLERRDEDQNEAYRLSEELHSRASETPEEYTSASHRARDMDLRAQALDSLLRANLEARLLSGELIARGYREPHSHGAPYLTISRHEWRVLKLELPDHAVGGGITYIGLAIGKVGTRQFLRRR